MKYAHTLNLHHLKATPQRLAILEFMHKKGHISIEELYQLVRQKFSSISLATLYKNIHTMMDLNLIREVKIAGHKTRYEIEKGSHAHIVCKGCGELRDITFEPETVLKSGMDVDGYDVEEISCTITGLCPECKTASSELDAN